MDAAGGADRSRRRRCARRGGGGGTLLLGLLLVWIPHGLEAQSVPPPPEQHPTVPPRAFLLSALLPGLGHHMTDQRRWAGYLLADLLSWVAFTGSRQTGQGLEEAYRDLAWVAARDRVEPRQDAGWQYYEELVRFEASGAWDMDPLRDGVQPETDPSTHNGTIWALARELFLPAGAGADSGPAYERALEYYLRRGIPPQFAWDWRGNAAARASFRSLIDASDRERRRSVGYAGVLLANRVLSVVDLYVVSRLGEGSSGRGRVQAHWDPVEARPWILFRLPAP